MKKFKEYLAERAKHPHGVVSDDKGFANRDYDGGLSLKPKVGKHLHPKEYYAPKADKNPGLMTADGPDRGKPFGDLATPGINPKNAASYGEKPVDKTKKVGGKKKSKLPTKKAMKVEHFLDKTQRMSDVQFTKHMLENVKTIPTPTIKDLYGREYTPEPAQTIKYVAQLMMTNENMMTRVVRELKRNNCLHLLISEVLQHPETYDHLNEAARGELGDVAARKMAMFFEGISPPRAGGKTSGPASAGAPAGGAFGGGGAGQGSQGLPGAGMSGGMDNGGGDMVKNSGGGNPGMGMGEDEMMGGGPSLSDAPEGDMEPEDDEDDMDDEDMEDDDGVDSEEDDEDDMDDDHAEDEEDDEDDEEEDEDDEDAMSHSPANAGMGMGGMGGNMGGMGM